MNEYFTFVVVLVAAVAVVVAASVTVVVGAAAAAAAVVVVVVIVVVEHNATSSDNHSVQKHNICAIDFNVTLKYSKNKCGSELYRNDNFMSAVEYKITTNIV